MEAEILDILRILEAQMKKGILIKKDGVLASKGGEGGQKSSCVNFLAENQLYKEVLREK